MRETERQVRGNFSISTDAGQLDLAVIHGFLSNSYWSLGLPLEVLQRAIAGSLCFGVYHGGKQVGFARVVTDKATFAYLCDVFVLDAYRGQGLGRWLMEVVAAHPDLQGLRRMVLVTRDAHGLYEKFGFCPLARPAGYMELHRPDVYVQGQTKRDGGQPANRPPSPFPQRWCEGVICSIQVRFPVLVAVKRVSGMIR